MLGICSPCAIAPWDTEQEGGGKWEQEGAWIDFSKTLGAKGVPRTGEPGRLGRVLLMI